MERKKWNSRFTQLEGVWLETWLGSSLAILLNQFIEYTVHE